MRPLTALLGILMGSAVALATGLLMTWIVILFLPAEQARFAPEHAALMRAIAVFTLFSELPPGASTGTCASAPGGRPPTGRRCSCWAWPSGCTGRSEGARLKYRGRSVTRAAGR